MAAAACVRCGPPSSTHAGPSALTLCPFAGYGQQLAEVAGNDLVFSADLSLWPPKERQRWATCCLAGEVLRKRNLAKSGRFFCKLRSVAITPNTRSINTFVNPLLRVSQAARADHRSIRNYSRKGSHLENFHLKPATIIN